MEQPISCSKLIGAQVPWFERDSSHGKVSSRDTSGNHPRVLVFCPSLDTAECRAYLDAIASDQEEYENMRAFVIIITPSAQEESAASFPFPVISDGHDLFAKFGLVDDTGQPRMGVVVVDRYGTVDACFSGIRTADLPREEIISTRLRSVESQCPECGVPEARWVEVETNS